MQYPRPRTTRCLIRAVVALSFAFLTPAAGSAASVTVDLATQGIVVDGFGGFGAMTPWWNPPPFYNDAFLNLLIDSLGLTLLRTELYPQPEQTDMYTKQLPYLRAIMAKAQASGEPLEVFASIWSPPARFKTSNNTTGGGMIIDSIPAYGQYLVNYVRRFNTDMGYNLYALSPQNEPQLCTGYNSMCVDGEVMGAIVVGVAKAFAQAQLPCWIHYADGIPWGSSDWQGVVVEVVDTSRVADSVSDIMSMHYSAESVAATAEIYRCFRAFALGLTGCQGWQTHRTYNIGKKSRMWNTEFGGQFDSWTETTVDEGGNTPGGAFTFATNLMLCLRYDFNGVIYWQLCEPPHSNANGDHYSLFYQRSGVPTPGPLFRVAQTVYRHVRPGAIKAGCTVSAADSANVWAVAYRHPTANTVTIVLLNRSTSQQSVTLAGSGLPASMDVYQTSSTQNHVLVGTVGPTGTVTLPGHSITALYNTPVVGVRTATAAGLRLGTAHATVSLYRVDGTRVKGTSSARAAGVYCSVASGRRLVVKTGRQSER